MKEGKREGRRRDNGAGSMTAKETEEWGRVQTKKGGRKGTKKGIQVNFYTEQSLFNKRQKDREGSRGQENWVAD